MTGTSGEEFTGVLTEVRDGRLTFEREFATGTMGFEMGAAEVAALALPR